MYVLLSTPAGSVYVNPDHVALIEQGQFDVVLTLGSGDRVEVDGTAESVAQALMAGDQVPF